MKLFFYMILIAMFSGCATMSPEEIAIQNTKFVDKFEIQVSQAGDLKKREFDRHIVNTGYSMTPYTKTFTRILDLNLSLEQFPYGDSGSPVTYAFYNENNGFYSLTEGMAKKIVDRFKPLLVVPYQETTRRVGLHMGISTNYLMLLQDGVSVLKFFNDYKDNRYYIRLTLIATASDQKKIPLSQLKGLGQKKQHSAQELEAIKNKFYEYASKQRKHTNESLATLSRIRQRENSVDSEAIKLLWGDYNKSMIQGQKTDPIMEMHNDFVDNINSKTKQSQNTTISGSKTTHEETNTGLQNKVPSCSGLTNKASGAFCVSETSYNKANACKMARSRNSQTTHQANRDICPSGQYIGSWNAGLCTCGGGGGSFTCRSVYSYTCRGSRKNTKGGAKTQ